MTRIVDIFMGVLLIIFFIFIIVFPPLIFLIYFLWKMCERKSLTNVSYRDKIEEIELEDKNYMFDYADFSPFKSGDMVFNAEHKELEIEAFSRTQGILCSDFKWYSPENLHYRIFPDVGDLMTVQKFENYCKESMLIDYDGFGYLAYPDGFESDIVVCPSDVLAGKLKEYPQFTMVVWYNR